MIGQYVSQTDLSSNDGIVTPMLIGPYNWTVSAVFNIAMSASVSGCPCPPSSEPDIGLGIDPCPAYSFVFNASKVKSWENCK